MWRAPAEPGTHARPGGFSLLEALVATTLFAVVMAGVYSLYITMQGTLTRGEMKSDLHQNARVGVDRMAQELRMAGYDPENALTQVASQPFNEIRAAGATCLAFVTYRVHGASEKTVQVTYSVSGTTLRRREEDWDPAGKAFAAASTQPLAESVSALAFTYYDAFNRILTPSGAVVGACPPGGPSSIPLLDAAQASRVRRVGVTLRVLQSRPRVAPESYTLTSYVYLRNR